MLGSMKTFVAALVLVAVAASLGLITRGHATEAEESGEEASGASLNFPQGELACVLEDGGETLVHVLLCRFENSERCDLSAASPVQELVAKFEEVKFLKIAPTPEGCSEITFSGSSRNQR